MPELPILLLEVELGPCSPKGTCPGKLHPVLSADRTAWEAEQCDTCSGRWWYQTPRDPSQLRWITLTLPGVNRAST